MNVFTLREVVNHEDDIAAQEGGERVRERERQREDDILAGAVTAERANNRHRFVVSAAAAGPFPSKSC